MLVLFSVDLQKGVFDVSGGAVASGYSEFVGRQHRTFLPVGGAVGGGTVEKRFFLLHTFLVSGGAVGGGHVKTNKHGSFSVAGGGIAAGRNIEPRRRWFLSKGGAIGGGHEAIEYIPASANMREIVLEGNAAAMIQLAASFEQEGYRVEIATNFLSFWLWLTPLNIIVYVDLETRGLMRFRQALNSGTDAVPIWSYGSPVKLRLRYWYDCPGWLFFTPTHFYIVSRHDSLNAYAYDAVFVGDGNGGAGTLGTCLVLLGSLGTDATELFPITTTTVLPVGITMKTNTLASPTAIHLRSIARYFTPGMNGAEGGCGAVATDIIVCESTGKVRGTLPNIKSTYAADLQPEQQIKNGSSRWIVFQNNGSSIALRR